MSTKDPQIKSYINLVRPKHWLKNILVFVPLLYAHNLTKPNLLFLTIQCFVSFCLISSVIYIINDIADVEKDRQHLVKCKRPIAAGQLSIKGAIAAAVILSVLGFFLSIFGFNSYLTFIFIASYALLNFAYSFILKHQPLIDCFAIAAGFVLRIYAGAAASESPVSEWLFLTIVSVSLFMAFGKRRGEIIKVHDTNATRAVLSSYDVGFMNGIIFVCAGLSIVFYALWALSNHALMIYTVPLIIYIVCKYLMIIHDKQAHGDPIGTILGNRGLLLALLIFGISSMMLLYMKGV